MTVYYRPIAQTGPRPSQGAHTIAGGWCWFDHAQRLERGRPPQIVPAGEVPDDTLGNITAKRTDIAGVNMGHPRLMGILNVTPDSFSDGGNFDRAERAVAHGFEMSQFGADIIDIGGESTRPGAAFVPEDAEITRTVPVIAGIRENSPVPVSIDTRKSAVAGAALDAGATIINDVSALSFDAQLSEMVAKTKAPICLMHAQGAPETMQDDPQYDDVLLDVYDYLAARISFAEAKGIAREKIIVDPGIGFGKTLQHNLALIQNISLFHGLGCAILLGASRKRFIGEIAGQADASARMPGSIAVTLAGVSPGGADFPGP